jgi:hypothetical protein
MLGAGPFQLRVADFAYRAVAEFHYMPFLLDFFASGGMAGAVLT